MVITVRIPQPPALPESKGGNYRDPLSEFYFLCEG